MLIFFMCVQIIAFFAPHSPSTSQQQHPLPESSTAEPATPTSVLQPHVPSHGSPSSAAMSTVSPASAASGRTHETIRSHLRNAMHSASALLDPEVSRIMLQGYLSVRESLQHLEGLYAVMGHAALSQDHEVGALEAGGEGDEEEEEEDSLLGGAAHNRLSEMPMPAAMWVVAETSAAEALPRLRRSARLQALAAAASFSAEFTSPDVPVGDRLVSAMESSHDARQRHRQRQGRQLEGAVDRRAPAQHRRGRGAHGRRGSSPLVEIN
jgi:hypothetical protein